MKQTTSKRSGLRIGIIVILLVFSLGFVFYSYIYNSSDGDSSSDFEESLNPRSDLAPRPFDSMDKKKIKFRHKGERKGWKPSFTDIGALSKDNRREVNQKNLYNGESVIIRAVKDGTASPMTEASDTADGKANIVNITHHYKTDLKFENAPADEKRKESISNSKLLE